MPVQQIPGAGAAQLTNLLNGLTDAQCKVGFMDSSKYDDGTPVAYVAVIQEFGAPEKSIPPRPFMRPTVARDKQKWADLAERGVKAIERGSTNTRTVLDKIGGVAAGGVKRSIQEVTSPPLSPVTLVLRKWKREGRTITGKTVGQAAAYANSPGADLSGASTKPLVFDGILFGAVTHVVEDGSQ